MYQAQVNSKVQTRAAAARYRSQMQAINQSHGPQAHANHGHISGNNSVINSGENGSKVVAEGGPCPSSFAYNINVDHEERTNKSSLTSKKKRAHIEISSPKNEQVLSQSSNKEANAGHVTSNTLFTDATKMMEIIARQRELLAGQIGYGVTGNLASFKANGASTEKGVGLVRGPDGQLPQQLRNIEPRLIEQISNEIIDSNTNVHWDDIAGLHHAKKCVNEMVIWPLLRPDIFKGCRSQGRGLLLFGPPGTGKTMIGKAIAGESKATFFYISASSITSKWVGEGEKLVRALFGVARCRQPAVIFVDEIDSLLFKRNSYYEHESTRRIKTQFLIEMERFGGSEQILLIGE
ncbi:unnamed protein product [Lactuca virosa]|uniref:AAA+ ATPase domain-containing protein n=1 Tax=Lactuca virosa TaxID=75947 RepID=A0AAU9NIV9_9ASTR|nr:unnamed protein product [Lactuca virosa]